MFASIRRVSAALLVLTLLPLVASATTYVVDVHAGPGYDFTQVAPALAVSSPGDVILVRPGNYDGFSVTSGITIVAQSGANLYLGAGVQISAIPFGQRVVISGVPSAPVGVGPLNINSCVGPVLLENFWADQTGIAGCSDVRMRNCELGSVDVIASRAEITGATIYGSSGNDGCLTNCAGSPHPATSGHPGLVCSNGADVHVGDSSCSGGIGGDGDWLLFACNNQPGGNGGDAIQVINASLLITGSGTQTIAGGRGGSGWGNEFCPPAGDGTNGAAIRVQGGVVLYSNVLIQSGGIVGPATYVSPADPCLLTIATTTLGTQYHFTIVGHPGDEARLRLGRSMVVEHLPFVFEDRLTVPLRSYQLGLLPANGRATFTLTIPSTLPPGTLLVAQGSTSNSTETRLTQSAPITVH